jgi:hypothetical protein
MSGAASLAAAKRRRGVSQTNNQRTNMASTGNTKVEQSEQPEQQAQPVFTPMSILTQHHIRLENLEKAQNAVQSAMGGVDEINDFDERLTSLEKHYIEKSVLEDKLLKLQKLVNQMDKRMDGMQSLLLKVQTSAVEANNNVIKKELQDNKEEAVEEL